MDPWPLEALLALSEHHWAQRPISGLRRHQSGNVVCTKEISGRRTAAGPVRPLPRVLLSDALPKRNAQTMPGRVMDMWYISWGF